MGITWYLVIFEQPRGKRPVEEKKIKAFFFDI